MGRRPAQLNEAALIEMAANGATFDDMAAVLGVCDETIRIKFRKLVDFGRAKGRVSLHARQWKKAMAEGDTKMLIWLGQNHLGQSAVQKVETTDATPKLNELFTLRIIDPKEPTEPAGAASAV